MRVPALHELDGFGHGGGDTDDLQITLFAEKDTKTLGDHGVVIDDADPDALTRDPLGARLAGRIHEVDDLTLRPRVHVFNIVKQHFSYRAHALFGCLDLSNVLHGGSLTLWTKESS